MKEYTVKEDLYDIKTGSRFAKKGDCILLLSDNNTFALKLGEKLRTMRVDDPNELEEKGKISLKYDTEKYNKNPEVNMVINPPHYAWFVDKYGVPFEDIVGDMNFNLGNVLKYVIRHGHKFENGMTTKEKAIQDLEKAVVYLNFEINRLKS